MNEEFPRFKPGQRVICVTADGERVEMVALSGREPGQDFPIVWVCTLDEWEHYELEADPMPWPARYTEVAP